MKSSKPKYSTKAQLQRHSASKSLSSSFPFRPNLFNKKSFQLNSYTTNSIKPQHTTNSIKQQHSSQNQTTTLSQFVIQHRKYSSLYFANLTEPVCALEKPFHSSRITQINMPLTKNNKQRALSNRTYHPINKDESLLSSNRHYSLTNAQGQEQYNKVNDYKLDDLEYNDHCNIIQELNDKITQLAKHIQAIEKENEKLRKTITKHILTTKKIQLKNKKLELSNNQLFQKKKHAEMAIIKEINYKRTIAQLKQKLNEFKCTLYQKQNKSETIVISKDKKNNDNYQLKPFNYDNIKQIEFQPSTKQNQKDNNSSDKITLLQNIIKESNNKIKVYEKYLTGMKIDPGSLLSKKKSSQNYLDLNIVDNWFETTETNFFNETQENTTRKSRAMSVYEEDFFELLYIILKSLEGKGITHQLLSDKLTQVYSQLSTEKSIQNSTKEEFADCFVQVLIDCIGITQEKDIMLLKQFFYALIESSKDDTEVFFDKMIELFDNIHDYSHVDNIKDLKDNIKNSMKPYKDIIIKTCLMRKSNCPKSLYVIGFKEFQMLIRDNKIKIEEDAMEFMIYYMKKTLRTPFGLYDLNIQPLIQLISHSKNYSRQSVVITNLNKRHKPSLIAYHHKSIS